MGRFLFCGQFFLFDIKGIEEEDPDPFSGPLLREVHLPRFAP